MSDLPLDTGPNTARAYDQGYEAGVAAERRRYEIERERCKQEHAKMAETFLNGWGLTQLARELSAAIRG